MINLKRGAIPPEIRLKDQPIALSESLKYLEISFESTGMFWAHLRGASEKAQRVIAALGRLM